MADVKYNRSIICEKCCSSFLPEKISNFSWTIFTIELDDDDDVDVDESVEDEQEDEEEEKSDDDDEDDEQEEVDSFASLIVDDFNCLSSLSSLHSFDWFLFELIVSAALVAVAVVAAITKLKIDLLKVKQKID